MTNRNIVAAIAAILTIFGASVFAQSVVPCKRAPCVTVRNGFIVGEVRAFAFGGASAQLLEELAQQGWVECAGQSLIRKDFDELWRTLGTTWGSADKSNVFYLPDLRGLFLRGWNHDRTAPPKYAGAPYDGDREIAGRVSPRPDAADAGGEAGASGNNVGTLQADQFRGHDHGFDLPRLDTRFQPAYDRNATTVEGHSWGGAIDKIAVVVGGNETRPSNAAVLYMIYLGRPARVIAPTAAEASRGETGRVVRRQP